MIKVGNTALSQIMQGIQQSYARYYNQVYEQSGHVFENRYKAYLCETDRYLLALLRYIHRNPLEASLTSSLDYEWSSHGYYSGTKKGDLVDTGLVCGLLSHYSPDDPVDAYLSFVKAASGQNEIRKISDFVYGVGKRALPDDRETNLIEEIVGSYGIDQKSLLERSRNYRISTARKELIRRLSVELGWPHIKIAQLLNVSPAYIGRVVK